jgi:hypothetical protein
MLQTHTAVLHDGAVSPKEFRQLVNRLEAEAASRPWLYKACVVALALLGYGYLLLILTLSVGLPLVFVLGLFTGARAVFIQLVLKLGIPLLALAAVLVRSLWVRIPAPVGILLEQLRRFIAMVFERTPPERRRFRGGYFTDGKTVVWEYPRSTPEGEQMDFIEVMEIADSLIVRHRVYWGWFGLRILERDAYLR